MPVVRVCCFAWGSLAACGARVATVADSREGPDHRTASLACGVSVLPFGRAVRGSSAGESDRIQGSCVPSGGPDCAQYLDVPARAHVRIDLASANFDGALVLLDDSGGPRSEISCADDSPQGDVHHSRIDAALEAGRYRVVVDGAGGEGGEFELFAQVDPLPTVSEVCRAADVLQEGHTLRGSTTRAPDHFAALSGSGARGPDHVHAFHVERPSRVRLRQQSEHDAVLYVRSDCADPASEVACDDDFVDAKRAMLALRLQAGRYYVFSDAYGREQWGRYALTLERIDEPPEPSIAALCREAQALAVQTGTFELDTFTAPSVLEGSCGGQGAPEIAFVVRVPERSELRAELVALELQATLYLRERCLDGASELICLRTPPMDRAPEASTSGAPVLLMTLEPGEYTLVIDGAEPHDMGAARLQVSLTPARGLLL